MTHTGVLTRDHFLYFDQVHMHDNHHVIRLRDPMHNCIQMPRANRRQFQFFRFDEIWDTLNNN